MRIPGTARVGIWLTLLGTASFLGYCTGSYFPGYGIWGAVNVFLFMVSIPTVGIGVLLLAAAGITFLQERSAGIGGFRILGASDEAVHPAKTARVRWPISSRVAVGMGAIVIGLALFGGTRYWLSTESYYGFRQYDVACLVVQICSVSLIVAGLRILLRRDTGQFDQTREAVRFAPFLKEKELSWGVTGLRHRIVRPSSVVVPNPVTDFPRMALVLVPFLLIMLAIFMIENGPWPAHGLPVRLVRPISPVVQRDPLVEALVVRVSSRGHLYLNTKEVTWAEFPHEMKELLGRRAEKWVYLEGDDEIRFFEAAEAIDIIQSEGGKVVLVTPRTRAEAK